MVQLLRLLLLPLSLAAAEFYYYYAWSAEPFGDCCALDHRQYREVQCVDRRTGASVDPDLCSGEEFETGGPDLVRPCSSKRCSCGMTQCSTDADACVEKAEDGYYYSNEHGACELHPVSLDMLFMGCIENTEYPPSIAMDTSNMFSYACEACSSTAPCMEGLPFYRLHKSTEEECQQFCIGKGFDLAGTLEHTGGGFECRCGASRAVSALYSNNPEAADSCLKFDWDLVERECSVNTIQVYAFRGAYEDFTIPSSALSIKDQDIRYRNRLVAGNGALLSEPPPTVGTDYVEPGLDGANYDQNPGWERNCWPQNCGPGAGPFPARQTTPPDPATSGDWSEYVIIRYVFQHGTDNARKDVMREAALRWRQETCINLIEEGNPNDPTTFDVMVGDFDSRYCWVMGMGNQKMWGADRVSELNLGWCNNMAYVGSVMHEIGHVVGMNHEQKRPDAGALYFSEGPYLDMQWQNIGSGWISQWTPDETSYTGSANDGGGDPHSGYAAYDYGSLMHYGVSNEAVLPNPLPAGVNTNGQTLSELTGNRQHLSEGDVRHILDAYQCTPRGGPAPPPAATAAPTAHPTIEAGDGEDCLDTAGGAVDPYGDGCSWYADNDWGCGQYNDGDFQSNAMCCACGGGRVVDEGVTPSPTPEATPVPTLSQAGCPWLGPTTTGTNDMLACADGTECTGWDCCTARGGRVMCPPNYPMMCATSTCGGGTQYCCSSNMCDGSGGERPCLEPTAAPTRAPTSPPVAQCLWLFQTSDQEGYLGCGDGTECDGGVEGWGCCDDRGGRAYCPPNIPEMCEQATCGAGAAEHCCAWDCSLYGGVKVCDAVAEVNENAATTTTPAPTPTAAPATGMIISAAQPRASRDAGTVATILLVLPAFWHQRMGA